MSEEHEQSTVVPDTAVLQSMSHPLRLRLLGLLRVYGPSTATKLAERVGESSGLTSYHLRQLAAAGLIAEAGPEEITGLVRTGGRERWWRASHEATRLESPPSGDEAAEAASMDFWHAVLSTVTRNAQSWLSVAHTWPREWQEATNFSDYILRLTPTEMDQLQSDLWAVLRRYRRHDPVQEPGVAGVPEDAAIVDMQFQLFPHPDQEPPR
jgi:DNA-binding transcriptional ArsR family regulator